MIIVVSHAGFLRQGLTGRWYFNADYRIFDFKERSSDDAPPEIEEWALTNEGGMGWSWEETVEVGDGLPRRRCDSATVIGVLAADFKAQWRTTLIKTILSAVNNKSMLDQWRPVRNLKCLNLSMSFKKLFFGAPFIEKQVGTASLTGAEQVTTCRPD